MQKRAAKAEMIWSVPKTYNTGVVFWRKPVIGVALPLKLVHTTLQPKKLIQLWLMKVIFSSECWIHHYYQFFYPQTLCQPWNSIPSILFHLQKPQPHFSHSIRDKSIPRLPVKPFPTMKWPTHQARCPPFDKKASSTD